jgi:hypothetical protein
MIRTKTRLAACGIAANVCGVSGAVLAQGHQTTDAVCTATNSQLPRAFQR